VGPLLHRTGRASVRHRKAVIAAWLLLLAVVAGSAAAFSGGTSDSYSIPGTESSEAIDRVGAEFPGADGTTGQVVLADDAPLDAPQNRPAVGALVAALPGVPGVLSALPPAEAGTVSADRRVAYVDVQFDTPVEDLPAASVEAVERLAATARDAGLRVELGGEAFTPEPTIEPIGEVIGLSVAAVVLALTLGSLVAAGLPLVTAGIGVAIGLLGVTALTGAVELNSNAPTLALMLGLAVGIDYALFVLARYRQELARGLDREAAVARATQTAGSAVVFAGVTVVIALAGLSVVGIPFLTQMGLAASATVALAVLIALTLVPALLAVAGDRIDAGRVGSGPRTGQPARPSAWVRGVVRRPAAVVAAVLVGLGVVAVPAADLELGLPGAEAQPPGTSARQAYDLVTESFGPGANGGLLVVVDGDAGTAERFAGTVAALPGVASIAPPVPDEAGDTHLLPVVPETAPTDSRTADVVDAIRAAGDDSGAEVAVTGLSALNIDASEQLADALPVYVGLVVGLASVLLLLVFRSVVVAVKAIAGFLLTLAATGGVVVGVFQQGWGAGLIGVETTGPIVSFLPILLVGIVFGLAMDYQVFLVTRMRERHQHGAPAREAVERGFTDSARVVSAAAVIMIAVFSGFILSEDPVIKSIGFALAVGVAVDAFVVRMTLVPAVLALLGERAWRLPRWLDRALPRVDVEGEGEGRPQDRSADRVAVP
jgi:RND superfamily putative drug exporter